MKVLTLVITFVNIPLGKILANPAVNFPSDLLTIDLKSFIPPIIPPFANIFKNPFNGPSLINPVTRAATPPKTNKAAAVSLPRPPPLLPPSPPLPP